MTVVIFLSLDIQAFAETIVHSTGFASVACWRIQSYSNQIISTSFNVKFISSTVK